MISTLQNIVGAGHVVTDAEGRRPFEQDATGRYQSDVLAVVRPANTQEVSEIVKLANATGIAIIPQGGNTGLAGGCYAVPGRETIILSLARMNTIRDIRPDSQIAIVEAGVILETLHTAVDQHGLIYPMTFGAKGSCMIGGNLSTNAGGSNVVRYGNTRDLVLGVEAVMANGDIVDLMSELHKDNTGYNLRHLLIGAEGTLGIITAAVVKLAMKPRAYFTAMVSVPRIGAALGLLNALRAATSNAVEAFEYMPAKYFETLQRRFPESRPPFETPAEHGIFLEVGLNAEQDVTANEDGSIPGVARLEALLMSYLEKGDILDAVICQSDGQRREMWERRERAYEATHAYGRSVNNDISLALDRVEPFLEKMEERLPKLAPAAEALTVAHLGDGNLHYSVWPHPGTQQQIDPIQYDEIMELVEEAVLELGGSFSAEHGIGYTKLPSMARRKNANALTAMRAIKTALDPANIMNPGKVLPSA